MAFMFEDVTVLAEGKVRRESSGLRLPAWPRKPGRHTRQHPYRRWSESASPPWPILARYVNLYFLGVVPIASRKTLKK